VADYLGWEGREVTVANSAIQSALCKHLSLMTPTNFSVVSENTSFDPTIEAPYLRSWLLPGETVGLTLGPNGFNSFVGVFQVDAVYPIDKGWGDAKAKVDKICTHFKRGSLLTFNDLQLRIVKVYPDAGSVDGPTYKISTSIYYEAYEQNS
jgi:hypothetical protein